MLRIRIWLALSSDKLKLYDLNWQANCAKTYLNWQANWVKTYTCWRENIFSVVGWKAKHIWDNCATRLAAIRVVLVAGQAENDDNNNNDNNNIIIIWDNCSTSPRGNLTSLGCWQSWKMYQVYQAVGNIISRSLGSVTNSG